MRTVLEAQNSSSLWVFSKLTHRKSDGGVVKVGHRA